MLGGTAWKCYSSWRRRTACGYRRSFVACCTEYSSQKPLNSSRRMAAGNYNSFHRLHIANTHKVEHFMRQGNSSVTNERRFERLSMLASSDREFTTREIAQITRRTSSPTR